MTTEVAPSARPAPGATAAPEPEPEPEPGAAGRYRGQAWKRRSAWIRRAVTVALVGAAVWFLVQRAGDRTRGTRSTCCDRVDWRLIGIAILFEAASMVVFARMQSVGWSGRVA